MKISVIIPAYNRAKLLPTTLHSLLMQQHVADEILVVDDGSTDSTADLAATFGPPVRVIRQSNQGPAVARNRGLAEAQGEWVHFFDSDDLALPSLHSEQLLILEQKGADVAYAPWVKCYISDRAIVPTNHVLQQNGLPNIDLVRALLTNWSVVPICCLIRTSLARQVGGFPPELRVGEDQLFFLRLLLAKAHVVHSPDTLVIYRADNPGKLSATSAGGNTEHLQDWCRFLLMAHQTCLLHGLDPCRWFDFRLRVWDARTSLAAQANPSHQSMLQALQQLERGPWPDFAYTMRRSLRRKGDSFTSRLLGRRAHRSFRAAAISPACLTQVQELLSVG